LIVLDDNLKLVNAIIPGTGVLGQVAVHGKYAYLELRIPDNQEYILVGADTVYNFRLDFPGMEYGFQTVVLCKYDLISEEVVWWQRIGNVGSESLRDMLIDSEGNLVIHGWTSSGYFTFTETDTVINYQVNKPFVAKYAPNGELLWGILNTDQNGENFFSIKLDDDDNIYLTGTYSWQEYHIGDTILNNIWWAPNDPTSRSVIIKYDYNGQFKWIIQLDGEYNTSSIQDIAITHDDRILAGLKFHGGGTVFFENEEYTYTGTDVGILLLVNSHSGKYMNHFITDGAENFRLFVNLDSDQHNNIDMYMFFRGDAEIFGGHFESYMGNLNGLRPRGARRRDGRGRDVSGLQ
jgi:hypothetical protein